MEPDISNDTEELSQKVARWITDYIIEVLSRQDRFTIALSGGNTPKKLYRLLASDPYAHQIDWTKLHFFWGDERYVPFNDDRNNAKMTYDALLNFVPVIKDQVHIIRTDIPAQQSADAYDNLLHAYFDKSEKSFDLVLLGLGDDAHTLSLFPASPVLSEKEKWVTSFFLKKQEMYRITLTVPTVNRSGRVLFLVAGADKAVAVYKVLYGEHEPDLYPAQLIQPYNGKCFWFLDKGAANEIENNIAG